MAKRKQVVFPPEAAAFFRKFTIDGLIDRIEEHAAAELVRYPKDDWEWPHKLPESPRRLKIASLAVQRARLLKRKVAQLGEGRTDEDLRLIRHALELAIKVGASTREVGMAVDGDKRVAGKLQKTKERHARWMDRARGILKNNPRLSQRKVATLISDEEHRLKFPDARKPRAIEIVIHTLFQK